MELGETHVPESGTGPLKIRGWLCSTLGPKAGLNVWGAVEGFKHLVLGWPAYLLIGSTGGPARGVTSHFSPNPLIKGDAKFKNKELFPGVWKKRVLQSGLGVAAAVAGLCAWGASNLPQMLTLYGIPYLTINAWLVLYTWLQHTDVDVPHFTDSEHSYVKGALHTIDRPCVRSHHTKLPNNLR